jgi:hypothetical protein
VDALGLALEQAAAEDRPVSYVVRKIIADWLKVSRKAETPAPK